MMRITTIITMLCWVGFLQAQDITSHVINSSGTFHTENEFNLYFSIGESFSTEQMGNELHVLQGFIQFIESPMGSSSNDIEALVDVKIYPNPSSDVLNINLGDNQKSFHMVNIIDVQGRMIDQNQVLSSEIEIDVRDLNAGTYFLQFQLKEGVRNFKFIKH